MLKRNWTALVVFSVAATMLCVLEPSSKAVAISDEEAAGIIGGECVLELNFSNCNMASGGNCPSTQIGLFPEACNTLRDLINGSFCGGFSHISCIKFQSGNICAE